MNTFKFEATQIEGLMLITPMYMEDKRGYFLKSIEKGIFHENHLDLEIYESFETYSRRHVIRGMHFQTKEPQIKIVRTISGEIYDVAVDLRTNSKTFGKWQGFLLSDSNRKSLYIPSGFAHGFLVKSDTALVSYQCIGRYLKDSDSGIVWNDENLNINWGIEKPIVSEKDRQLMRFETFVHIWGGLS